jgi:RNA polymerase primary sigma factor
LDILNDYTIDSLDRELNSDENSVTLLDTISDDTFKDGFNNLISEDIKSQISIILDTLKPRDKNIMIGLFGLDGEIPKTLRDLSDEYGITREMVRQIKNKSLKKIKLRILNSELFRN